jgi:hypothetical protein
MSRFKVTSKPTDLAELEGEDSVLKLHDVSNPDINLFNLVDDEVIKLGGSRVEVYKYLSPGEYDEVYMESTAKVISNIPIVLYAKYDPRPVEEALTQFGVEVQNDQVFIFNKSYVNRLLGRDIIAGDVLKPQFQNMKFEVYQVQEESFESYSVYHLMVYARLLRDTSEIHNDTFNTENPQGGKI